MVLADLGIDGPGGGLVVVDGGRDRQVFLLERHLGIDELDRRAGAGGSAGRGPELEIRKGEIAVVGPAGTVLGQRFVRKRLEPHGRDAVDPGRDDDGVDVVRGILAACQQRAVVLLFELGAAVGFGVGHLDDQPGGHHRLDAAAQPRFKTAGQLLVVEFLQGLDQRRVLAIELGFRLGMGLGLKVEIDFAAHGGRERGHEPVVVSLRDRIEFVVVAAGAADRQAQHGRAERGGHVVQLVVALFFDLVGRDLRGVRAGRQKPGRHQRQVVVGLELVAGNLPADELIERHVVVESSDHEVAVVIRRRPVVVLLVTVAFGKTGQVEPVAAPALAVMRAVEQTIDEPVVGVAGTVGHKRLDLVGRRGKPKQIEIGAADQLPPIGGTVGYKPLCLEPRKHEMIDAGAAPVLVLDRRHLGPGQRLERPKLSILVADGFGNHFGGHVDQRLVVGGAGFNPGSDAVDGLGGQLIGLVGHVRLGFVPHELYQQAFARLAGHDGGALFPAFEQAFAGGQVEFGVRFLAAMTLQAMLGQQRADMAFENLHAGGHPLGMIGRNVVGGRRTRADQDREKRDDDGRGRSGQTTSARAPVRALQQRQCTLHSAPLGGTGSRWD